MGWLGIVAACILLVTGCFPAGNPGDHRLPDPGRESPSADSAEGVTLAGDLPAFPYKMDIAATDLDVPWDMDIAPDGRIFLTERSGKIRVIEDGKLSDSAMIDLGGEVYAESEAGLLGLVIDKNFDENRYFYVYHTYRENGETKNRVLRMIERDHRAFVDKVLIDDLPGAPNHDGGRVKIGPDGMLYITAGDALDPLSSQDVNRFAGKILRIRPDGSIPEDNPFPGSPVYSLGHRNPQGLAWHPDTGMLYSSEHGQSAHDELNLVEPGANYGWPLVQGSETAIPADKADQLGPGALKPPLAHSGNETWAPSGMAFITKGPWKGMLLAANLRGNQVMAFRLDPSGQTVLSRTVLFKNGFGRIRNVYEAPDGSLYVMTNNRDGRGSPRDGDDKLIRFRPDF